MKKAFFFDIDGTLLDTPSGLIDISPINKKAILSLQKEHLVFIATGRTKCFIVKPIREFPFSGFVTCNGAYVEYMGECVYKQIISQDALEKLIQVCKKYDFDFYIEAYDKIYVNDLTKPSVQDFSERWEMNKETMVDNFKVEDVEAYIAMIKVNDEKELSLVNELLGEYFDIARHPNQLSFDLNIKGIHKGVGIEELIKVLKMDIKDTYAFGDGNNDIEMLSVVGHGIAMKNAVEPLKEVAEYVSSDVKDDGVAKALLHYEFVEEL